MGISLPLYLDWGNPVRDIEIKKRYAYLVNWKRRKFHNYTQGWHSGSHAIAWAAITTFVCTGFLRPPIQNVAFAVPRLNRNVVCINLIYSYYILFFSRFDTAKFPQNYDIQK